MKKISVLVCLFFVVIYSFAGCKKAAAPTMPAPVNTPNEQLTATAIVSMSDSIRATQTSVAMQTSTALALLFTRTITMTHNATCTDTPTATVTYTPTTTCTATETPPVYSVYDAFSGTGSADASKWDVESGGTECYAKYMNGAFDIRAKTSTRWQTVSINVISKYPDGTKAFKGNFILSDFSGCGESDNGEFDIYIGNNTDGFKRFYYESGTSNFQSSDFAFEVKYVYGNTYAVSIAGQSAVNENYSVQPQIKMVLEATFNSGCVGSAAESVFWMDGCYYY